MQTLPDVMLNILFSTNVSDSNPGSPNLTIDNSIFYNMRNITGKDLHLGMGEMCSPVLHANNIHFTGKTPETLL